MSHTPTPPRKPDRRHSLVVCLFGAALTGLPASAAPSRFTQSTATDAVWMAVGDHQLASLRGGFTTTRGLDVSFGISNVVYVNGQLMSETRLQMQRMGDLTRAQMSAMAEELRREMQGIRLVQNGPGNSIVPSVGSSNPGPSVGTGAATPSGSTSGTAGGTVTVAGTPAPTVPGTNPGTPPSAAPGANPGATPGAPPGTVTGTVEVNNDPGTLAVANPGTVVATIPGTLTGTVIQNTLNNQHIVQQTTIDASSNGLGMLRLSNLQGAMFDAFTQSIGQR